MQPDFHIATFLGPKPLGKLGTRGFLICRACPVPSALVPVSRRVDPEP